MTIYPWLAGVLALMGGAVLAGTAAVRKHVIGLHHRWIHIDELTGQPVDPYDETAGHMEVPLGSDTVRLRLTGNLQNAWDMLSGQEQDHLTKAQQRGMLLTMGSVILAAILVLLTPSAQRLLAGGLSVLLFFLGYIIWSSVAGSMRGLPGADLAGPMSTGQAAGMDPAAEETK